MENKVKLKLIPVVFIVLFLAIGFFSISFTIKSISSETKINKKTENIEVNTKIYNSLIPESSLPSVTVKDSSGYGRENPFDPYK